MEMSKDELIKYLTEERRHFLALASAVEKLLDAIKETSEEVTVNKMTVQERDGYTTYQIETIVKKN